MDSVDDAGLAEAEADTKERELNDAIGTIRHHLYDSSRNRASELINAVQLAYWLLNIASEGNDVPEYRSNVKLNGIALGQVIMEHTNPDAYVNKRLWFNVAEHMGPDFGQGMYNAAVFVTKIA